MTIRGETEEQTLVLWFQRFMLEKLAANRTKPHWSRVPLAVLLEGLDDEVRELKEALISSEDAAVIYEAADVANSAALLAGRVRALAEAHGSPLPLHVGSELRDPKDGRVLGTVLPMPDESREAEPGAAVYQELRAGGAAFACPVCNETAGDHQSCALLLATAVPADLMADQVVSRITERHKVVLGGIEHERYAMLGRDAVALVIEYGRQRVAMFAASDEKQARAYALQLGERDAEIKQLKNDRDTARRERDDIGADKRNADAALRIARKQLARLQSATDPLGATLRELSSGRATYNDLRNAALRVRDAADPASEQQTPDGEGLGRLPATSQPPAPGGETQGPRKGIADSRLRKAVRYLLRFLSEHIDTDQGHAMLLRDDLGGGAGFSKAKQAVFDALADATSNDAPAGWLRRGDTVNESWEHENGAMVWRVGDVWSYDSAACRGVADPHARTATRDEAMARALGWKPPATGAPTPTRELERLRTFEDGVTELLGDPREGTVKMLEQLSAENARLNTVVKENTEEALAVLTERDELRTKFANEQAALARELALSGRLMRERDDARATSAPRAAIIGALGLSPASSDGDIIERAAQAVRDAERHEAEAERWGKRNRLLELRRDAAVRVLSGHGDALLAKAESDGEG